MNQTHHVSSTSQNQPTTVIPALDRDDLEDRPSTSNAAGAELAEAEPEPLIRSSRTPAVSAHALDDASTVHAQSSDSPARPSALGTASDEDARVAALAYRFYEEEGYPEGRALDHWTRAEQEVRGQRGG